MKPEFVRNPYNYDSDQLSHENGLECKDPSLTQQQFLIESDINYIADTFLKTGMAPQVVDLPTSGDFNGIFDFQSAMNLITEAKQEFMKLPAKVRSRFDNDPHKVIEFLDDANNRAEAEALGLIPKPERTHEPRNPESAQAQTQERPGNPGTAPTPTGQQPTQAARPQAGQDDRGRTGSPGGQ